MSKMTKKAIPAVAVEIQKEPLTAPQVKNCRGAIQLVGRLQMWRGMITREQFRQLADILDSRELSEPLCQQIGFMMALEAEAAGAAAPEFNLLEIFQFILDHWEQVWAIIQVFIDLFTKGW